MGIQQYILCRTDNRPFCSRLSFLITGNNFPYYIFNTIDFNIISVILISFTGKIRNGFSQMYGISHIGTCLQLHTSIFIRIKRTFQNNISGIIIGIFKDFTIICSHISTRLFLFPLPLMLVRRNLVFIFQAFTVFHHIKRKTTSFIHLVCCGNIRSISHFILFK